MKDVAHATCENVGITFTPTSPDAQATADECNAAMAKYLQPFAAPTGRCLKCDRPLGGLLGSCRWGLAWGEMVCVCGYPARAYHKPVDEDGKALFSNVLTCILQYHPDQLIIKSEPDEQ